MRANIKALDVVAEHPAFFKAAREPALVKLPSAQYLTLEGRGDPNGPAFQAAIAALFSIAYTLKMAKKALGRAYTVAPLEGQWWAEVRGKPVDLASGRKIPASAWRWKLMIMVPDFIELCDLAETKARVHAKKNGAEGPIAGIKLEKLAEGLCVQALHVGPYAKEPETLALMKEAAAAKHLAPKGRHHEIYLGDPRRAKPERLKTILRLPVARA